MDALVFVRDEIQAFVREGWDAIPVGQAFFALWRDTREPRCSWRGLLACDAKTELSRHVAHI
eukprot:scaffold5061_cov37-Prasinocladus_malaysianus.AAC.1